MKRILSLSFLSLVFVIGCGGGSKFDPLGRTNAAITCGDGLCTVPSGNYVEDMTWSADNIYLLNGKVFIGEGTADTGVTLTIEPGTLVLGSSASKGYLAILPHSKIIARGTENAPIIFSSDAQNRNRGDWGGLIISGNAPVNCGGAATTCQGEGDSGAYGGTDPTDDSGALEYVRVEFAGNQVNPTDELNGIAFQGVGSDTEVSYVHVHRSKDDGIEFFGGAVNVDHILITGIGDDSLDWTFGWTGTARDLVIQQYGDNSDNGIEADNNSDQPTASPRSQPTIDGITLIGSPDSDKSDIGVLLRAGTGALIQNAIVAHFNDACVDIDNPETFDFAADGTGNPTGNLNLTNSVIWCPQGSEFKEQSTPDENGLADPWSVEAYIMGLSGNMVADPDFVAPFSETAPDFTVQGTEAAGKGGLTDGNWFGSWTEFPEE